MQLWIWFILASAVLGSIGLLFKKKALRVIEGEVAKWLAQAE